MSRPATKTSVTGHLDHECSRIVRSLGYCERCMRRDMLEAAHVWGRKLKSVRWDLNNILCLCKSCHAWFHDRPTQMKDFFVSKFGEDRYQEMKYRANATKKWTLSEMQEELVRLKRVQRPDFLALRGIDEHPLEDM